MQYSNSNTCWWPWTKKVIIDYEPVKHLLRAQEMVNIIVGGGLKEEVLKEPCNSVSVQRSRCCGCAARRPTTVYQLDGVYTQLRSARYHIPYIVGRNDAQTQLKPVKANICKNKFRGESYCTVIPLQPTSAS